MGETDQTLKLLVRQHIRDIAAWLLGREITSAEELNVELTTETPRVDMVFRLELADARICLFHLEFQGRRSKPEMSRRQLNHLSRLALQQNWPLTLESFVLYTEPYAGSQDSGNYQLDRLDGSPVISWHYQPVHLWREAAEPLLALARRGIIPLMGLMRIQSPETTLPTMVQQLNAEPDVARRKSLLTALLALMSDKEHLAMLEKLVDSDEEILDTPFIRRYRNQVEQARVETYRQNILEAISQRLDPPISTYRQLEQKLAQIEDLARLQQLFTIALQVEDSEVFMVALVEPVL
jgi:hypothetical protein